MCLDDFGVLINQCCLILSACPAWGWSENECWYVVTAIVLATCSILTNERGQLASYTDLSSTSDLQKSHCYAGCYDYISNTMYVI
jgi:hypothetical protein